MKFKPPIKLICIAFIIPALSCADNASEREYVKEDDPKISQALGIGTLQFEDCFYGANSQGNYYNRNDLLPCLQQYNPDITDDQLNEVLDQYRPERY